MVAVQMLVPAIKKTIFASQIFGVFPYSLTGNHFRLSILRVVHLFLILVIMIVCLFLTAMDRTNDPTDSSFEWNIAFLKQTVLTTTSAATMLAMLFIGQKLDHWLETASKSQEVTSAYLSITFSKHRWESVAHFAAIIVLLAGEVNRNYPVEYIKDICGSAISGFIIVAFINQFVGMADILREAFIEINRGFSKPTLERLEASVIAYERLASASDVLNQAYGTQLLLMVGGNFLLATINAFQVVDQPIGSSQVFYALQSIVTAWSPLRLVQSCVSLVNESKEFNVLLSSILVEETGYGLTESARLRLHLSMKKEIEFTARGFFVLDYGLISAMLGAVTTYLVILIQFDESSSSPNV